MSIKQRRHVLKVIVPLFVLALSAGAMSACGDNNSDTAATEPTSEEAPTTTEATVEEVPTTTEATVKEAPTTTAVEEAPTTTAVDEPAALTAETTGTITLRQADDGQIFWEVEVTMEEGSVRSFPADNETLELIWPDGTTTAGVRVVIEEIDGEQRITGLAE